MDARNRKAIDQLLARAQNDPAVLAVILFGSVARHEQGPRSDVDVCLVLSPALPRPIRASMRLAYSKESDLDVQIYQDLPVFVRRRVLREGKVLLVKDENLLYDVAFRTMKEVEDFRRIHDDYLGRVARA